jgi:hypothetical protein
MPAAFYAGFAVMGFYEIASLAPQTAACINGIFHIPATSKTMIAMSIAHQTRQQYVMYSSKIEERSA